MPSSVLHFISPFEALTKRKPNYEFLRLFGCTCFLLIPKGLRNKFEPTAQKCVFIGYSNKIRVIFS